MAVGMQNHVAWARSDIAQCYHELSCICIGTRHHRVEALTDFLQLFRGYSLVLKKGGSYLFLKLKAFCILAVLTGSSTYKDLKLHVKTKNAFLSFQV